MLKLIKLVLICCCLGLPAGGCAAIMPVIPQIVSVVTDAMLIMDIIDTTARTFFDTHPQVSPEVRQKYADVYAKALNALNVAQAALRAAEDLDQAQYDRAFAEFKQAYSELMDLLGKQGMVQGQYLAATPGQHVYLPEPLALTYRVE